LLLLAIFRDAKKSTRSERAKVVSGVALSTTLKTQRIALPRRLETVAADAAVPTENQTKRSSGLSWRAFVVRQNFSNRRREVIDPRTRHDDAVAAAMSFFSDAQESPALVFPELHVEMLALYLQFSRLDDVIHFSSEGADSTAFILVNGSKIRSFLLAGEKGDRAGLISLLTQVLQENR
jgi:hypothetical protein